MARPSKNSVDYFPFYCKEGKGLFCIESKYGNDGFAVWIKILRQLAVTDHHYINLSSKMDLMFLASKCKVSEETLISIINDLAEFGDINIELWSENKVIWSQKFIESINDAYSKRNNKCITYEGLLLLLDSLRVRKLHKKAVKGVSNTQSILEYNILDKKRLNNSIEYESVDCTFQVPKHRLILYVEKNYPNVFKLMKKNYPTDEQCENLKLKIGDTKIIELLNQMENYAGLEKKYQSFNLTIQNWAKNLNTPQNAKSNNDSRIQSKKSSDAILELAHNVINS